MTAEQHQQTGGFTKVFSATPTVDASNNYATGDNMGGLITLTNVGRLHRLIDSRGIIQSVVITDLSGQNLDIDVIFFDTNPTNSTFTDNVAQTIVDADLLTIIGVANVTTWAAFVANGVGVAVNLGITFDLGVANGELYCALVARGAHNLESTSDLTLRVGILQD